MICQHDIHEFTEVAEAWVECYKRLEIELFLRANTDSQDPYYWVSEKVSVREGEDLAALAARVIEDGNFLLQEMRELPYFQDSRAVRQLVQFARLLDSDDATAEDRIMEGVHRGWPTISSNLSRLADELGLMCPCTHDSPVSEGDGISDEDRQSLTMIAGQLTGYARGVLFSLANTHLPMTHEALVRSCGCSKSAIEKFWVPFKKHSLVEKAPRNKGWFISRRGRIVVSILESNP